jgi:hypothetical protein
MKFSVCKNGQIYSEESKDRWIPVMTSLKDVCYMSSTITTRLFVTKQGKLFQQGLENYLGQPSIA